MRLMPLLFWICLYLLSCNHPEGKRYERNQGNQNELNSKINSANSINKEQNTVHSANGNENGNILKMEIENGVRYVWIEINGLRLRFIFDTGASSICISSAEATVLFRQGTLQKEDILDVEYFQDATGTVSEGTKVNLREIRIGNLVLENVQALVVDNVNAPLLLGQTVLERFGSIEIDNINGQIILK